MRELLGALLDLVLPRSCAGCGRPGEVWCGPCRRQLGTPTQRGEIGHDAAGHPVPIYALAAYQGPVRSALLAYKERGRRELGGLIAERLAEALRRWPLLPDCLDARGRLWLVPVPSRGSAAARRGGQHVAALARGAASRLAGRGVPVAVAPGLRIARGARDSVGLDPAARRANLRGRVLPVPAGLPASGTPVVLVDDLVTTTATVAACTAALRRAGVDVRAVLALSAAGGHKG